MPQPLNAHVSLFAGSTDTTPTGSLPLATVLQHIQTGIYRRYVEQLRRTLQTQGEEAYGVEKKRSIAFTPAGTFTARNSASLETPSGCLNLDIDDLSDLGHARARIGADPHLLYMFTSPSGQGLKLGIHVKRYADAESYRYAWLAVERYLVETYPDLAVSNDRQCKDVSRLCYMSWDPDLYQNPNSIAFVPPPPPPAPPRPSTVSAGAYCAAGPVPPERQQRYADQAIRAAVKMLDASVDGIRDLQRLKASRLLGGYIAGGILTEAQAKAGIAAAVERNTTKLTRAWRVVERGLRYGEAVPITLGQLEDEYQQWVAIHGRAGQGTRATPAEPPDPAIPPDPVGPPVQLHQLPEHLAHHPNPRIRAHYRRVYRQVNALKLRLAREGALL
jgi:hypothetical protein